MENIRANIVGGKPKNGGAVGNAGGGKNGVGDGRGKPLKAIMPSAIGVKISDLSDDQLYKKCVECGMNAKEWIRKFAAMLPEVEKRGLHRKKGFTSLYEFAKKLAGMSEFTVDRILRLVKRLEGKPILLREFESGRQSWSKIETVSYIATKETEEDLAKKIEAMPQRALMAYVSQKRAESVVNGDVKSENVNSVSQELFGLEKMFDGGNNALVNYQEIRQDERYKVFLFHASNDIEFKLRLFKQGLEKEQKRTLIWNEVFEVLFQKLEERRREAVVSGYDERRGKAGFVKFILKGKESVAEGGGKKVEGGGKMAEKGGKMAEKEKVEGDDGRDKMSVMAGERRAGDVGVERVVSRHIPVEVKRQILAKYGYKCGFPKCNFPCFVLHHTKRFVLFRRHDAESIVPLCKKHHDLVHGGCIANEEQEPRMWVLRKAEGGKIVEGNWESGVGEGEVSAGREEKGMEGNGKSGVGEGKVGLMEGGVEGVGEREGVKDGVVGNGKSGWSEVEKRERGGEGGGSFVKNGMAGSIIDKTTGEILDTKEKVDEVVMKYKMKGGGSMLRGRGGS